MRLRLSQGQLNALTLCPRKFQHLYLDQLGFPPTPEQQERMTWGSRFHLLMQQCQLGLPIDSTIGSSEAMQHCITALQQAAPDLFQSNIASRQAEHRRTLEFEGYLLTVIYDLLILDEQQAQILDWKTYPRPQDPRRLTKDWQTRLYPFVLAETSNYKPDQISMTYWFVQAGEGETPQPQSLQFSYRSQMHQQIEQDLKRLLNQLTLWLQQYEAGEPLPQVDPSKQICQFCPFIRRCQRDYLNTPDATPSLAALAAIEEVAL